MPIAFRQFAVCFLCSVLILPPASWTLDTPLSDTAVRDAYFLGQHHDSRILAPYTKFLPAPRTGPHIAAITFLTPFAQVVQQTSARIGNYSAQQAEIDHRGTVESVKISILIKLTSSYRAVISPGDAAHPDIKAVLRSPDFWKEFSVTVLDSGKPLQPLEFSGHSDSACARRGPCTLSGATLELSFPADSFASDTAVVQVTPPEGDPVVVEFDLASLR